MAGSVLNSVAVARQSGGEAGEILNGYIMTNPVMVQNAAAPEPAAAAQPKGAGGAVDPTRG